MLRRPFSHPLDIFIQDDSLFMMEAMLPFLDPQIMKPLAIYIKFSEMMIILNNINNQDFMRRCCFHKDINNYDAVLSSLKDMGMSEDIEQAMKMKSAMDMMQHANFARQAQEDRTYPESSEGRYSHNEDTSVPDQMAAPDEETPGSEHRSSPDEKGSVFDNIMDILKDYDLHHSDHSESDDH